MSNANLCVQQYKEVDLYRQLSYFCYVLDATRCLDKVTHQPKHPVFVKLSNPKQAVADVRLLLWMQLDQKARLPFEKEFAAVGQTINLALMEIQKIRDRCAFGWVQLKDLAVSI